MLLQGFCFLCVFFCCMVILSVLHPGHSSVDDGAFLFCPSPIDCPFEQTHVQCSTLTE